MVQEDQYWAKCFICICACTPCIIIPIGFVMLAGHNRVSDLPIGVAFPTHEMAEFDISCLSSSSRITAVPIQVNNVTVANDFTLFYPPPPTALNLKTRTNVLRWEASTVSTIDGVVVFFDVDTKSGWTEVIETRTAVFLIIVGFMIIMGLLYGTILVTWLFRRWREQ